MRLIKPELQHHIYDPCCGSGGMLTRPRSPLTNRAMKAAKPTFTGGGQRHRLWSIAKVNMLLHGISTADLHSEDTLGKLQHVKGGELSRFDRILTNPPFSLN